MTQRQSRHNTILDHITTTPPPTHHHYAAKYAARSRPRRGRGQGWIGEKRQTPQGRFESAPVEECPPTQDFAARKLGYRRFMRVGDIAGLNISDLWPFGKSGSPATEL